MLRWTKSCLAPAWSTIRPPSGHRQEHRVKITVGRRLAGIAARTPPTYHRHITMISTRCDDPRVGPVEQTGIPAAALFHSLSDPTRLAILCHLALGEHKVVDLVTHLGAAQSTVSKHLSYLRQCGLVQSRAAGRASLYSRAVPEDLTGLLAAAQRLLAVTGDAVELCPTYGTGSHSDSARPAGSGPARDAR